MLPKKKRKKSKAAPQASLQAQKTGVDIFDFESDSEFDVKAKYGKKKARKSVTQPDDDLLAELISPKRPKSTAKPKATRTRTRMAPALKTTKKVADASKSKSQGRTARKPRESKTRAVQAMAQEEVFGLPTTDEDCNSAEEVASTSTATRKRRRKELASPVHVTKSSKTVKPTKKRRSHVDHTANGYTLQHVLRAVGISLLSRC